VPTYEVKFPNYVKGYSLSDALRNTCFLVGICDVHGDDYKYGKDILWCYRPRDDDIVTRVCNIIRRLEEQSNAMGHVRHMLQLTPHLPTQLNFSYARNMLLTINRCK